MVASIRVEGSGTAETGVMLPSIVNGVGVPVGLKSPIRNVPADPIVPLDLHLGHVLEFTVRYEGGIGIWTAIVADVDGQRMVLVPSTSPAEAESIARRMVAVWQATEAAAIETLWRDRVARLLAE